MPPKPPRASSAATTRSSGRMLTMGMRRSPLNNGRNVPHQRMSSLNATVTCKTARNVSACYAHHDVACSVNVA